MRSLIASLALAACLASPVQAQMAPGKAQEAQTLISAGKVEEGLLALDEFVNGLWEKAPLTLRHATWVQQPASGVGIYVPRPNDAFPTGVPLYLYAELVGFGWKKDGEAWSMDLAADLVVKSEKGDVLGSQKDFQRLRMTSRARNREFMINFTYTLSGLPKGRYLIETVLRDQVNGKTGSVTMPMSIQ